MTPLVLVALLAAVVSLTLGMLLEHHYRGRHGFELRWNRILIVPGVMIVLAILAWLGTPTSTSQAPPASSASQSNANPISQISTPRLLCEDSAFVVEMVIPDSASQVELGRVGNMLAARDTKKGLRCYKGNQDEEVVLVGLNGETFLQTYEGFSVPEPHWQWSANEALINKER